MSRKLKCVLLVDDDEATNYLHSWILESSGSVESVRVAQGGREALDYLRMSVDSSEFPRPDLIFLDINMPAMNGWEFLEQYQELDKRVKASVVLVMLTTSMFPEDEVRASRIPAISGFEAKPLTPEALEGILAKYFP